MFFFDEKIKVEKNLDHHIDVEFCQESIFRIHKSNGALSRDRQGITCAEPMDFTVNWVFTEDASFSF